MCVLGRATGSEKGGKKRRSGALVEKKFRLLNHSGAQSFGGGRGVSKPCFLEDYPGGISKRDSVVDD